MKLSLRLQVIASYVEEGELVADIGTDHARIPIFLIREGITSRVIATDLNRGPIKAAAENVKMAGLEDEIDLRIGDGLSVLQPGEVHTVIIAGMGGGTMVEIFEREPKIVEGLSKLILQPMNDEYRVRRWLNDNCWYIADEELISEDGKIYTIIKVERGEGVSLTEDEMEFGPRLLAKKHSLLKVKLNKELEHRKKVLAQIQEKAAKKVVEREAKLTQEIQAMERVLKWL